MLNNSLKHNMLHIEQIHRFVCMFVCVCISYFWWYSDSLLAMGSGITLVFRVLKIEAMLTVLKTSVLLTILFLHSKSHNLCVER